MPLANSKTVSPVRQGNNEQASGLPDEAELADEKIGESWRVILVGFVMC